ncbi:hypothetical protein [Pedobacter sp. Hv1]|uniref:hypothetical protein n=1 Tax=Pedobacter sp. Hv1 TaxID=1740090 RepID=UPI0006D895A6|nr:hypothetical protein [Pedobacter sp. Hv1]KQC01847.1 hypothetical protein AQF98_05645 [Pedobacter sp. Hv1]
MNKTVYILGAGFSMSAGAPSQEKLIQKMFELHKKDKYIFNPSAIRKFRLFLSSTMHIPKRQHYEIPLEDIFTPLDKCIQDNLSYRNLNLDQVKEIRGIVYYLIGKTLQYILQISNKDYINNFAKHLVENCKQRKDNKYRNWDNVSVLTSNWDILLDTSVQQIIDNNRDLAVVDYCCHISSYKEDDERVKPGLEILGKGGYNVKILKLHGSLNWLQCPRCQRVYVDLDDKIAINQYIAPINCRHCNNNFGVEKSHELNSNMIMPTYLKNLSNPQYKLIWQNAGIELSEAKKIVFIGYSLPQADYEMRQLLSRMIRPNAEIEVVGYSDNSAVDIEFQNLSNRYKNFFGKRLKLPIYYKGAKQYIDDHF